MLCKLLAAALVMFASVPVARAAAPGPFGLGIVLIDPTGLSGNYFYERQKSIAAHVGWSSDQTRFTVDHLWYRSDIIKIDKVAFDLYFGVGGRYFQYEKRNGDDVQKSGIRAPIGASYIFRKVPIQVYGELGPALILVDDSAFVIDVSIGGRFYF